MSIDTAKINSWDSVGIDNSYMFRLVMEDKQLCKTALELILGIRIKRLVILEPEKSLEYKISSKGIRLDIYAEDENGISYDLEMQACDSEKALLGKRTRYYQSLMDGDILKKGEAYENLKKSFVIFICKFDPFDKNYGRYTFNHWCDENKSVGLGDEATKILLNTKGDMQGMSKELKAFLSYIETGKPADAYTAELDNTVNVLKKDEGVRAMFMTWEQVKIESTAKGKREGIEIGKEIGRAEGRAEGEAAGEARGKEIGKKECLLENIRSMMKNLGLSSQKAMDALGISPEEQAELLPLL